MCEITVIIPSFNTPLEHLETLYKSMLSQSVQNFQAIIVDDCSEFDFYNIIDDPRFSVVRMEENGGPAKCRNYGAALAKSDKLFFTDSDCRLPEDTLKEAVQKLSEHPVIIGDTITTVKTPFGKAVAYLGFPGGGSIGFENVWKVDKDGFTDSISSCNLAVTREFFQKHGMFDTSFPVPGGEDTYFAKKIVAQNEKILYNKKQIVFHVERGSYKSFLRWQIARGRGNYHLKEKLNSLSGFYKLRLWSFKNSLIKSGIYFPLVAFLILVSFIYQKKGYKIEKKNMENK